MLSSAYERLRDQDRLFVRTASTTGVVPVEAGNFSTAARNSSDHGEARTMHTRTSPQKAASSTGARPGRPTKELRNKKFCNFVKPLKNKERIFKPYMCASKRIAAGRGKHGAASIADGPKNGLLRATPAELVRYNSRSVDPRNCSGLPHRIQGRAGAGSPSPRAPFPAMAGKCHVRGDTLAVGKRGYNRAEVSPSEWLHVTDVSDSKEGWVTKASDQSQVLESVQHFKMEGIHLIKELLQEGDWMIKLDLKDAYFAVPIHQPHRKFLQFQWKGRTYHFNCLPFGLSSAPRVFTKLTKPIMAWLRQLGIKSIAYIDDFLLVVPSPEEGFLLACLVTTLLQKLGFTINSNKSILNPTQDLEFLGFHLNSVTMAIQIPQLKLQAIESQASSLMRQHTVTGRDLAKFIGKASSMALAIPMAPLFYWALQALKNATLKMPCGLDSQVELLDHHKEELSWWTNHHREWNGLSLRPPQRILKIQTDASNTGWGAVCNRVTTGGPWSWQEHQYHINYLELLAAHLAVQMQKWSKTSQSIYIWTTSQP